MRDELRLRLIELGSTDDEITRAEAEGWLPLLAFDCLLMPGQKRYDLASLADAAGIDEELARRLWRAVGFPDVPAGIEAFTDRDVDAARLAFIQASKSDIEGGALLQQIRVISGSLARIASVEAHGFVDLLEELHARYPSDDEVALAIFDDQRLVAVGALIDYLHRVQLRAAVWRVMVLAAEPEVAIAVGFADLSGYTQLSAELDASSLSELVGRWEAVAYDTIAASGARVVKTIGDEVMFVGLTREAVTAALALRDGTIAEHLPPLRIGLAAGPVISRDGDYFGPVVNLASRLTELATAGEMLVPASLRDDLGPDPGLDVQWVSRGEQQVRSIGAVEIFALERTS